MRVCLKVLRSVPPAGRRRKTRHSASPMQDPPGGQRQPALLLLRMTPVPLLSTRLGPSPRQLYPKTCKSFTVRAKALGAVCGNSNWPRRPRHCHRQHHAFHNNSRFLRYGVCIFVCYLCCANLRLLLTFQQHARSSAKHVASVTDALRERGFAVLSKYIPTVQDDGIQFGANRDVLSRQHQARSCQTNLSPDF